MRSVGEPGIGGPAVEDKVGRPGRAGRQPLRVAANLVVDPLDAGGVVKFDESSIAVADG